ncbi:MAG: hypothetical protein CM15mP79_3010 [Methanobacteriota archaeon]|nr:MAG: hypothetical protein CM15mP79_3010 [Euryarchaeota archaeon]
MPELRTCEASLSKTSIRVDPGKQGQVQVTFENTGNAEWDINVARTGPKANWVSVDGASSGLLPYDTSSDERSFTLNIQPDDSLDADSVSTVIVQGRDVARWPVRQNCASPLDKPRAPRCPFHRA